LGAASRTFGGILKQESAVILFDVALVEFSSFVTVEVNADSHIPGAP